MLGKLGANSLSEHVWGSGSRPLSQKTLQQVHRETLGGTANGQVSWSLPCFRKVPLGSDVGCAMFQGTSSGPDAGIRPKPGLGQGCAACLWELVLGLEVDFGGGDADVTGTQGEGETRLVSCVWAQQQGCRECETSPWSRPFM